MEIQDMHRPFACFCFALTMTACTPDWTLPKKDAGIDAGEADGDEQDGSTDGEDAAEELRDAAGNGGAEDADAAANGEYDDANTPGAAAGDGSAGGAVDGGTEEGCGEGYVLQDGSCRDVNECFEGTHTCHMTATCENTEGGYDCACPLGYSGGTSAGFACAPRIGVGARYACALQSDGLVKCWGSNEDGRLGDGTELSRLTPVFVKGLDRVVAIALHDSRSACALRDDGTVVCWGSNAVGQLGDGTTVSRSQPELVEGLTDAIALSVAYGRACAVTRGGAVKCWGSENWGLGATPVEMKLLPTAVAGLPKAASIGIGRAHGCIVTSAGTVWCWGDNSFGQLGSGSTSPIDVPVQVVGTRNALHVTSGASQSCILRSDHWVECWGYGVATPEVILGFGAAISVSSTNELTFAVQQDGSVVAAQTQSDSIEPQGTSGPIDAVVVAGSIDLGSPCAVIEDGTVGCWGNNSYGELGNGTTTSSTSFGSAVSELRLW